MDKKASEKIAQITVKTKIAGIGNMIAHIIMTWKIKMYL